MPLGQKFNLSVDDLAKGVMNLGTDAIKVVLTNQVPVATMHVYGDLGGELPTANGYTAGGAVVPGTGLSNASGTETLAGAAVTWTSATGNMGPFRYAVFYDSTPSATKTLLSWYDYGSNLTLNGVASDTLTITPAGGVLMTIA